MDLCTCPTGDWVSFDHSLNKPPEAQRLEKSFHLYPPPAYERLWTGLEISLSINVCCQLMNTQETLPSFTNTLEKCELG